MVSANWLASLLLAPALALAADSAPPKDVTGKTWILAKLNGESVDPTIRSTISIDPNRRAGGTTGCNRWFGTASFEGTSVAFTGVGMTRMACQKPAMDREEAFTRMLGLVRSWKLSGAELGLAGEDGTALAVLRSEPLPAGKK